MKIVKLRAHMKEHTIIQAKIKAMESKLKQREIQSRLKKCIDEHDINSALKLYEEIPHPAVHSFVFNEIKKSIEKADFVKLSKILKENQNSHFYCEIQETIKNYVVSFFKLKKLLPAEYLKIMTELLQYFQRDLFTEVTNHVWSTFMQIRARKVLEIDRWIETGINLCGKELGKEKEFRTRYFKEELKYIDLVKNEQFLKNGDEKLYFIKRVSKRWSTYGPGDDSELIKLIKQL